MSMDQLQYYKQELSFIRRMGGEFAQQNPKIAERLRLSAEACQDPHAERMIEAFAFLTARLRRKLDDEFPEITQAFLGAMYPHYLAPVPSMAIAQFQLEPAQAELAAGYSVAAGAMLDSDSTSEGACRFRTCYPLTVWPIQVKRAELRPLPLAPPGTPAGTAAVLTVELSCFSEAMTFSKLQLPKLRFFLKGQDQHVFALYELLFNNTVDVALARSNNDPSPIFLGGQTIRPVGFNLDEGLLPYSPRSFPGYRLLTEYFSFPQKFLFFDISPLESAMLQNSRQSIQLRFYLNRTTTDLEHNISADTFRLGATPIVNLFPKKAEPILLTQSDTEYRIVPDSRRPVAYEIYSIESVSASSPDGQQFRYLPFYSIAHAGRPHERQGFWHAARRPAVRQDNEVDHGTEMFLSLVDLDQSILSSPNWTLDVETICLNRDLPGRPPFGGGRPGFQLCDGGPVGIQCLTAPTPTLRPPLREGLMWRLISHLSLNHLSLGDAQGSPDAMREILSLYDIASSDDTRSKIAGILDVRHRRVVGRAAGVAAGGFCRGIEVSTKLDLDKFSDNSSFLFAAVLERFLSLYCSINSFTRLIATSERNGEIRQWSPRVAERALL